MPVISALPLSNSTGPPQQHKQSSRKGKKEWRKNVDMTDMAKGMDECQEGTNSGSSIDTREAKDIFVIDILGSRASGRGEWQARHNPLQADQIIAQRSNAPHLVTHKRPGIESTCGPLPTKRVRANWVSHKELKRLRSIADGHHETTIEIFPAEHDIWSEESYALAAPICSATSSTFTPNRTPQAVKVPISMLQPPVSLSANGNTVAAVPTPLSGNSYNPSFLDYNQLFKEECRKVIEVETFRLAKEEKDRLAREAISRSAAEAEGAEERAELSEWEDDSVWEGRDSGREDMGFDKRKKHPERKTQAQRNRIKRRKEADRVQKSQAISKAKEVQATRIKQLALEVFQKEQVQACPSLSTVPIEDERDGDKLRKKQLGNLRLFPNDLELVLPDELQESLRLLRPEGNLLKDRYKSLLIRGRMESRRRIHLTKAARTKLIEKWSYKEFALF